jgi:hypothetical protein
MTANVIVRLYPKCDFSLPAASALNKMKLGEIGLTQSVP